MENKKTVPAALAVMTFFLAAVLAAAAVHLRQSAGQTEAAGGEKAYFESVLLSGQSEVRPVAREDGASARDASFPPAPLQQIRLHLRRPGKWTAYVPADLSRGFYLYFSGFASLRLSAGQGDSEELTEAGEGGETKAVPDQAGASPDGTEKVSDRTGASPNGIESVRKQAGAVPAETPGMVTVKSGTYLSAEDLRRLAGDPAESVEVSGLPEKLCLQAAAVSRDGEVLEETELTLFFAAAVPTLYLDTASGSMEAVNADKSYTENGSFLFFREDGSRDVAGTCRLHGRGNSSWNEDKKQYSLNLTDSLQVLGMDASKKFALIANHSDDSNLRNRTVFDLARQCGMPASPQSAFVNVYLNGVYNGLYLLAQRPNAKGGSVRIAKLEKANEAAAQQDPGGTGTVPDADAAGTLQDPDENGNATDPDGLTVITDPDGHTVVTDPDGLETHAFGQTAIPADITGGYLLEMDGRYEDEDCWFSTQRHHFVIKYPEEVPLQEAQYIAGYVREAEKAIYAADGKNPDTGKSWEEYLDADSWAKMYLLQDFMAQWDVESFSFFIYKDAGDPLLYCGPVWDFDLSMGTTGLGRLPNLMQRSRWLTDHRPGWLTQLYAHEDFSAAVRRILQETFAPALGAYLDAGQTEQAGTVSQPDPAQPEQADGEKPDAGQGGSLSDRGGDSYAVWMDRLRRSAAMDAYRWEEEDGFPEGAPALRAWLLGRLDFYTDLEAFPEKYCRVTFRYGFADMDVYIRRGSRIGFVPTEEYGEHLYSSFRKKYGDADGWTAEDGTVLTADTVIDRDQVFFPFETED